jgi:hypothetical protein
MVCLEPTAKSSVVTARRSKMKGTMELPDQDSSGLVLHYLNAFLVFIPLSLFLPLGQLSLLPTCKDSRERSAKKGRKKETSVQLLLCLALLILLPSFPLFIKKTEHLSQESEGDWVLGKSEASEGVDRGGPQRGMMAGLASFAWAQSGGARHD